MRRASTDGFEVHGPAAVHLRARDALGAQRGREALGGAGVGQEPRDARRPVAVGIGTAAPHQPVDLADLVDDPRLVRPQRVEDARQPAELHARDRARELAHAQVLAGERLGELLAARARVARDELAALVRVARRAEVQRLVVGDHEPALAGGDVLLLLERERAERAERAETRAVVRRAERLRGVLDDGNAVAVRRRRAPRRGRTRRSRGARR